MQFNRKGFQCIGIDKSRKRIVQLQKKYKQDLYYKYLFKKKNKHRTGQRKKMYFSSDYFEISNADIIIMCLPTPLSKDKKPDMSAIKDSLRSMKKYLKKGQLLSLESTTYPETTETLLAPFLQKKFIISKDFFLLYSPERESPVLDTKEHKFNLFNTPKICSGYSKRCSELGKALYAKVVKKVIKTNSTKNAEMAKMIENIYRAVNIGLVNELKMLSYKMKINIHEVLRLAGTKPFGFTKFNPGPGLGGHCIPIDPYYLTWYAKKYNFDTKFIKLAGKINSDVTKWCISEINKIIKKTYNYKDNFYKKIKILILGAAYKANIDDLRESPSLKFFEYYKNKNVKFDYCDPYIKKINTKFIKKRSINLKYKNFKKYTAVIILTDHNIFNKRKIITNSKLIIDTRGYLQSFNNKKIHLI